MSSCEDKVAKYLHGALTLSLAARVCNLMELPFYSTLLVVDPIVFARGSQEGGMRHSTLLPREAGAKQEHLCTTDPGSPLPPSQHIVSILFSWTMRNVRNYCFYFRIFFHYRIWELAKCSLALLIHHYSCTWFDFSNQKKIKPRVKNNLGIVRYFKKREL